MVSQGYVRDMPQHIYIQPGGGGCISDMSICRKTQNRDNLGLKRCIFMSKTHMFYVFMFSGMLHLVTYNSHSLGDKGSGGNEKNLYSYFFGRYVRRRFERRNSSPKSTI